MVKAGVIVASRRDAFGKGYLLHYAQDADGHWTLKRKNVGGK